MQNIQGAARDESLSTNHDVVEDLLLPPSLLAPPEDA